MLETARVIVNDKCTRDHTIMFVAFDLEEFVREYLIFI